MALIPPDAGIRMRMQTEASLLQPMAPVHGIPADLPELQLGQTFTARIQEVLPDNAYKALVAGRSLTLQLPEGAKSGDMLELVVIDRTPKVVIAQLAPQAAAAGAPEPYPHATLSRAAQMIGQLLVPEGETPQPAPLNRGEPLLPRPPAGAQDLAPALMKAVSQSGLFYEAHQAQWITGKLPLTTLLQEPQGRQSAPDLLAAHRIAPPVAGPEQEAGNRVAEAAGRSPAPAPAGLAGLLQGIFRGEESMPAQSALPQALPLAQSVPEEIRPLVQQQFEAAAGQPLLWRGEVWPGQVMDWRVDREKTEERNGPGVSGEDAERWRTSLSLTTPRLGRVDAALQLEKAGVRIALAAPEGATAADLGDAIPALAAALAAAGVPLLAMQVKHESG